MPELQVVIYGGERVRWVMIDRDEQSEAKFAKLELQELKYTQDKNLLKLLK